MEKVTINIEGSSDEVVSALQRLTSSLVKQHEAEVEGEAWSEEELLRFWNTLTEGAKAALRVVAKHPDGYQREKVREELDISGSQLAGQLSSVGHALHNFPNKISPFGLNWHTWHYEMIPELADLIIRSRL